MNDDPCRVMQELNEHYAEEEKRDVEIDDDFEYEMWRDLDNE